jgi:hypothetical protein
MRGVTICDRDSRVLKHDEKSYKLTILIAGEGANVWEQELDLCENCIGHAIRGIAQRVFLDDLKEEQIVEKVGCPPASKRAVKRPKAVKKGKEGQILTEGKGRGEAVKGAEQTSLLTEKV